MKLSEGKNEYHEVQKILHKSNATYTIYEVGWETLTFKMEIFEIGLFSQIKKNYKYEYMYAYMNMMYILIHPGKTSVYRTED